MIENKVRGVYHPRKDSEGAFQARAPRENTDKPVIKAASAAKDRDD